MNRTLSALALATSALSLQVSAEPISYAKIVEFAKNDAAAPGAIGKTVQIDVTGKGETGYFAKPTDQSTFACDSGDKKLTSYKKIKGKIEGRIVRVQYWEGSMAYSLENCQFVTAVPAGSTTSTGTVPSPSSEAGKKVYEAGNKHWQGTVRLVGDERSAKVNMDTENERGSTCTLDGTASYSSPSKASFKASGDAECTAELALSGDTLKVKSQGCASYCGASGPGFDYAYKLKR